jgi:hypothetical protein
MELPQPLLQRTARARNDDAGFDKPYVPVGTFDRSVAGRAQRRIDPEDA